MNDRNLELEIIVIKAAAIIGMSIIVATFLNAGLAWVILSS